MQKNVVPDEYKPWVNLGAAIIRSVVRDYKKALQEGKEKKIAKLEKWFRSAYFTIISAGMLDPEFVIKLAKEKQRVAYERRFD